MIFLTSDWHFNHSKEFIYKPRGFDSAEEMNSALVERHNSLVTSEDDVYILGDLCLGGAESLEKNRELISSMNGKLHVVFGNHDTPKRRQMYAELPNVVETAWTQEVTANYPVTDIFGDQRTAINAELDVYLREKFDQYGIIIDTVNFTDISVDAETAEAIQKKVNAQQELELANIEAQTAKVQAEKEKEVAEIQAEQALIQAQAQAEAEANAKIAASLTPELIEKIKYEQWNGQMPSTMAGTDSSILITP